MLAKLIPLIQEPVMTIIVAVLIICVVVCAFVIRHYNKSRKKKMEAADEGFRARIPQYASLIGAWLENERPYLDRSFRFTDVAAVVPLNRTYLARIFSEGLGENFSGMVCRLRMEEAMRLLMETPDLSIAEIAEHCGFASHSSFHRAFVRFTGMKPGDYRQQNIA